MHTAASGRNARPNRPERPRCGVSTRRLFCSDEQSVDSGGRVIVWVADEGGPRYGVIARCCQATLHHGCVIRRPIRRKPPGCVRFTFELARNQCTPGTGTDARGAGCDHRERRLVCGDTPGGLHAQGRVDGTAHQRDIRHRGARFRGSDFVAHHTGLPGFRHSTREHNVDFVRIRGDCLGGIAALCRPSRRPRAESRPPRRHARNGRSAPWRRSA